MQVSEAPAPSTPLAAQGATAITTCARLGAKTRVRGIDLAGEVGTWDSTAASTESCWASTFTCDETVVGRQKVTNLRLPGQYDERLLGSLGLQGPYYNWNRWYLPGVGRYLELDPIGLRGYFNAPYRPDWYNYAQGNPFRGTDPLGLASIPPYLWKLIADFGVPEWIIDMIVDWTYGSAGGAVCAARACRRKATLDYFEAFGDCLKIILDDFKLGAGGILTSDQFVAPCAGKCRDITNSGDFKKKCLSCK